MEALTPPQTFALKTILDNNSEFVVKFKLNGENCSITVLNEGDNQFVIQSCEGFDPDVFEFGLTKDKKQFVLTKYTEATKEEVESQIFFDPVDDSFYIINGIGAELTFDGEASVNNLSGTLVNSCPEKVEVDITISGESSSLVVYFIDGELWLDVIDRYDISKLKGLIDGGESTVVKLQKGNYAGNMKYGDPADDVQSESQIDMLGYANYKADMVAP